MARIVYIFAYIGIWLLAILPFRVLYVLSDLLCFLLYRVARYRRKVVRTNLKNSFPEKSEKELKGIEKQFYHYISDYMLESLKMLRMSKEDLLKRMEFIDIDKFTEQVDKKGGALLMMPHYANFEWVIGVSLFMNPQDVPMQVYKNIRNPFINRLFNRIRSRFDGYNVPKHDTAREIIKARRAGKKMGVGLVADQSPNVHELKFWTTFLNQETAFMDGGERIARMMDFAVFYCELEHVGRGKGRVTFKLMTDTPKETAEGEITEMFARHVEATIRREPAYWFWSHKRWKHKRPQ
ncbi:MAG: lysophospholipid acyltransferase family protein [Bacteroides sp.]|nr:lysophospholipid acyltransferase family protein [Bacteroides sp.]